MSFFWIILSPAHMELICGNSFKACATALTKNAKKVKLKPSFLIKEDTKGPTSLDINSFVLVKESVWIGATYRAGVNLWKKTDWNNSTFSQNSLVGVVEAFVRKNVRVGYSYDYSLSDLGDYTNGTHEISLGFTLNTNKKSALLTPRYF